MYLYLDILLMMIPVCDNLCKNRIENVSLIQTNKGHGLHRSGTSKDTSLHEPDILL